MAEPSAFEFDMAVKKLKRYKSLGSHKIPAELIKTGSRIICWEIHELTSFIWYKEELPDEWKESFNVPCYKKGDETDCSNYSGISLLPTMHKIVSNILLSRLTPYAEEIIGYCECGF